ncbi:glycosyltransferase family 2 protein [Aquirufa sp. ROCK2-A2]
MKVTNSLDMVHPVYNPHAGWAKDLLHYFNLFSSDIPSEIDISVYVVNDGSKQGILPEDIQLLQNSIPNFYFISLAQNQGKGGALREAVRQTKGDIVIYTDADYPYLIENATEMLNRLLANKADIVVGVRDEQYYDQLPLMRKIFSLSLKVMNYVFFPKLKVKDTQSGLKGFNQLGKEIFLKTKIPAFLFDMEFLVLASKTKNIRVDWIYVQVREGVIFSTMKAKTILTELLNFSSILIRGMFK